MARGRSNFRNCRRAARDVRDYAHDADDKRVPYAGCQCWTCANKRDDLHYAQVEAITAVNDLVDEKGGTK